MHISRVQAFERYLTRNAVPFSGLSSFSGSDPEAIVINFLPAATPEQIAWANAEKLTFSWAKRRMLSPAVIASTIASKTAAQQNAIMRRLVAFVIANLAEVEVEAFLAEAAGSIDLPYNEVDPNP